MYKIAVLIGSLRRESFNRKLAKGLEELGKDLFTFEYADLGALPLFNEDLEANPPAGVTALKELVKGADGVLIVSPEYNRGYTPVLKNALDWGSRPSGKGVWSGKPCALAGMSPGAIGTAVAQSQIKGTLSFLGLRLLTQPELYLQYNQDFFAPDGTVAAERTRTFLGGFLKSFSDWIGTFK